MSGAPQSPPSPPHRPAMAVARVCHVAAAGWLFASPVVAAVGEARPLGFAVGGALLAGGIVAERQGWRTGAERVGALVAVGALLAAVLASATGQFPVPRPIHVITLGVGGASLAAFARGLWGCGQTGALLPLLLGFASLVVRIHAGGPAAPALRSFTSPPGDDLVALALGVALLTVTPDRGPMQVLTVRSVVGDTARITLPLAILLPLGFGLGTRELLHRGLDSDSALGLLAALAASATALALPTVLLRGHQVERANAEARAELDAARRRYRVLLDSLAEDAVFLLDSGARVVTWSAAATRVTGYPEGEALGLGLATFYTEADREEHVADRDLLEAARTPGHSAEGSRRRRDGTPFRATQTLTAIRDGAGSVTGYAVVLRDVTDARQREHKRRRQEEVLADVRAETEANQLKSRFLAHIAHEIRTPVWAMGGIAELLKDRIPGPLTPLQGELVDDLLRKGGHLRRLVEDVLDLARAESGHLEFRPQLVDVATVIGECVGGLRPVAGKKNIALVADLTPLDTVRIDSTRLRQVVYNFLSNAVKFTPAGGEVVIRLRPEAPASFRIEVQDNGPGISPSDMPRLFVEFQQLAPDPSAPEKGTGLGLALVRRIVETQGGRVGVHSAPGGGSVFFCVLPRAPRVNSGATAGETSTLADVVLVVDDDPVMTHMLTRGIERHGLRVRTASTGEEALRVAGSTKFGAAVVDLVLPDMSGVDLARTLRGRPATAGLGIVLITAAEGVGDTVAPEVREVLHKPFRLAQLDAALARIGLDVRSPSPDP